MVGPGGAAHAIRETQRLNELAESTAGNEFLRLAVAYVLALPLAWDRERETRSAGLRTFPLVAVAACGFVLMGRSVFAGSAEAEARILQGVVTGIGFIGGGAILRADGRVHGTATASAIWSTGAIGAAAAYGNYTVAALLAALNLATFRLLGPLKKRPRRRPPAVD